MSANKLPTHKRIKVYSHEKYGLVIKESGDSVPIRSNYGHVRSIETGIAYGTYGYNNLPVCGYIPFTIQYKDTVLI